MEGRSLYTPAHTRDLWISAISYQGAYMSMDLSAHLQELDNLIAREKAKGGTLIPVLHQAQELYGFLPKELQDYIADGLGIPQSTIYGVVTFLSLFARPDSIRAELQKVKIEQLTPLDALNILDELKRKAETIEE